MKLSVQYVNNIMNIVIASLNLIFLNGFCRRKTDKFDQKIKEMIATNIPWTRKAYQRMAPVIVKRQLFLYVYEAVRVL